MSGGIIVTRPGTHTLIQDAGRFGQHRLGLTTGGPMDARAHALANLLCGNPASASALEATLGNLELEFRADALVAVTGAESALSVNGEPRPLWQTLSVGAGERLALGFPARGCRNYVAVAGGIAAGEAFGSTATVVREGIGGMDGRALQQGDQLALGQTDPPARERGDPSALNQSGPPAPEQSARGFRPFGIAAADRPALPDPAAPAELRVLQTYQAAQFSPHDRERFFTETYSLGARMDRMGCFLEGEPLAYPPDGIVSEGICLGAIQITPDGLPIILMRDRPTIGGYAKIGTVLSMDLDALAQMTAGQRVRFAPIGLTEAQRLLAVHRRSLRRYIQTTS